MPTSFCSAVSPRLIFARPETKEEFDLIDLPEMVHGWKSDKVQTLLRADGAEYESRCHSKLLGDFSSVTVIFQWFEYRVAGEVQP